MTEKRFFKVTEPSADAMKAASFMQRLFRRQVFSHADLGKWKRSRAHNDLIAYINNTSTAIQGYGLRDGYKISRQMLKLCGVLKWLDKLLQVHYPLANAGKLMRCGASSNPMEQLESTASLTRKCYDAYQGWMKQMHEQLFGMLEQQVRPHCRHINELAHYLMRSFGNAKSNEFNSKHELMFVLFLCALFKTRILHAEDTVAAALLLYQRYLELVRRLILFYRLPSGLEPDLNCIDERYVVAYIWGTAQLARYAPFEPPQSQLPQIMSEHADNFMLLSSLQYLQKQQLGLPITEYSYQLWCVLSQPSWPAAYACLMQNYMKCMLNDLQLMKDVLFCDVISFEPLPAETLTQACLGERAKRGYKPSSSSSSSSELSGEEEQQQPPAHHATFVLEQDDELLPLLPPVPAHIALNAHILTARQHSTQSSSELEPPEMLRRSRLTTKSLHHDSLIVTYTATHNSEFDMTSAEDAYITNLDVQLGIQESDESSSSSSSMFSV